MNIEDEKYFMDRDILNQCYSYNQLYCFYRELGLKGIDRYINELQNESKSKNREIERLNNKIKSIVYQCYKSDMSYDEFKQIWVNAMGKIYEPSQIDELEKELGVDKE